MNRTILLGGVLGAAALALAGCGRGDAPPDHRVLGPDADALRTAFDADEGKVRALFLASPT